MNMILSRGDIKIIVSAGEPFVVWMFGSLDGVIQVTPSGDVIQKPKKYIRTEWNAEIDIDGKTSFSHFDHDQLDEFKRQGWKITTGH